MPSINKREKPAWYEELAKYELSDPRAALGQLLDTFIPLLALLTIMFYLVLHRYSYWLVLLVAVFAAGMLIRMFIFQHDCSHGSFFPSTRANDIVGFIIGVLTLTPYRQWRWSHLRHHGAFGNLDRRDAGGDIWLLTVDEYQALALKERIIYWIYRYPPLLFGIGSTILFFFIYRLPISGTPTKDRVSVWLTDLVFLAILAIAYFTVGLRVFFLVMAPVWIIAWMIGVWLFYVQHQFEGVYWAHQQEWDFYQAALAGSSYYKLPKLLQWFTGNIGLHHIHHLRPRIPNYHLQQAYDSSPVLQAVKPLTLRSSLKSLSLNLYDEPQHRLVSFRQSIKRSTSE
ncbi:MAG: fatty acid desaturase [bacterium]